MKKHKKLLCALSFIALIGASLVIAFYAQCSILSKKASNDVSAVNAIKHSLAAYRLYSYSRLLLTPSQAEGFVLSAGFMNEYAERITKFWNPDPPREVMKDVYNNYAGILAAQWSEGKGNKRSNDLEIILALKDNGVLITSRKENPFYKDIRDEKNIVATTIDWFYENKNSIKNRIISALQ